MFDGGYYPYAVAVADVNKDGRLDVITVQDRFIRILPEPNATLQLGAMSNDSEALMQN